MYNDDEYGLSHKIICWGVGTIIVFAYLFGLFIAIMDTGLLCK